MTCAEIAVSCNVSAQIYALYMHGKGVCVCVCVSVCLSVSECVCVCVSYIYSLQGLHVI